VFQGTKLGLTVWFLAIYLISQAKTGLSALAMKRQLGVSYPTAWLIHHKLMQAMTEREERYVLEGNVQVDDAYLGGERNGGKVGRGSENKVPFVAAVSLSDEGHPLRMKLTPVAGFTLKAIAHWAKDHLTPGSTVFSDGLACFSAVTAAACRHEPTVVAGRKPRDLPEFQWINTVLGNLKTSLSGTYHGFRFGKYAERYLAAFSYRSCSPGICAASGLARAPAVHTTVAVSMRSSEVVVTPLASIAATAVLVMISTPHSAKAASMTGRGTGPRSGPISGACSITTTRICAFPTLKAKSTHHHAHGRLQTDCRRSGFALHGLLVGLMESFP
jgi:hypothetical protein